MYQLKEIYLLVVTNTWW